MIREDVRELAIISFSDLCLDSSVQITTDEFIDVLIGPYCIISPVSVYYSF